jgi:hypothetical protein
MGEATLGDLVAVTGLFRREVLAALEALLAGESVHVRVSDQGDVVYHPARRRTWAAGVALLRGGPARAAEVAFDRKTLRLIRTLEGVVSMAELVEHTGLPLAEADAEMKRLAECYGGVPHVALDGHVVWAFPELMSSTLGRLGGREPRPAWARAEDPMERARAGRHGLPRRAVGAVLNHPWIRFRSRRALRRYALGHVIQASLAGKGVVSLGRTVAYLRARAGGRTVSRRAVEGALRQLAHEFDAPISETNGELFFGFRNVKRQFLASHLVRRRLRLGRRASGRTVFDTADTPRRAGQRDLESFDLELLSARLPLYENHDAMGLAD